MSYQLGFIGSLLPIIVGCLWGVTNPFIRQGVIAANKQAPTARTGVAWLDSGIHSLSTPALIIPQGLNLLGGVIFASSLRFCSISTAGPISNGVTLAVTACVETLLGEPSRRRLTALGVALVCCGATLCTLST
ncbi:hypothetical protein ACKKBG_A17585 [Auxenochlorella protothecoides x Auxenochlorella symbiontica]